MGAEFRLKKYEVYFVDGDYQILTMSQFHFRTFLRENKVKGYKVLRG